MQLLLSLRGIEEKDFAVRRSLLTNGRLPLVVNRQKLILVELKLFRKRLIALADSKETNPNQIAFSKFWKSAL